MAANASDFDVYLGTEDGVRLQGAAALGLAGHQISALHAARGAGGAPVILAGTYGEGLWRSTDGGETWHMVEGMTAPAVRTIVPDPWDGGALLCGTEPARLFRSHDRGATWDELPGVAALEASDAWFLPYSPRAGAVRNIVAPAGSPGALLASVEVGGLLRSGDGGGSWSIEEIAANDDIHQVTVEPDGGRLWASLGYAALPSRTRGSADPHLGGVAWSDDGGRSWTLLHTDYTRSTIPVPGRPGVVLSGPAPEVGRRGRIVVTEDGGESWKPAGAGIDVPMPDMVELFQPAPDGSVYAICSRGRLLRAEPGPWVWTAAVGEEAAKVVSIAFLAR